MDEALDLLSDSLGQREPDPDENKPVVDKVKVTKDILKLEQFGEGWEGANQTNKKKPLQNPQNLQWFSDAHRSMWHWDFRCCKSKVIGEKNPCFYVQVYQPLFNHLVSFL